MDNQTGIVTEIQRSSFHDGPSIRTTVFLKGCSLHCEWCHNPECISFKPQIMAYPNKCIGCGRCDEGCYSGAKVICGRHMSVDDVMAQILPDQPYFTKGGGVTISGGEPLCQPDFTANILRRCREKKIHCAIETSLAVAWQAAKPVLQQCDLIMVDLKLWNANAHKKFTGQDNSLIIENIKILDLLDIPFILRTPVVPSVNRQEIGQIAKFAAQLKNMVFYELLPYHSLGASKATALGMKYKTFEVPKRSDMVELAKTAAKHVENVRIGGSDWHDYI